MRKLQAHLIGIDQGKTEVFSEFETGGEMWTGSGARERRQAVVFSEPFRSAPVVQGVDDRISRTMVKSSCTGRGMRAYDAPSKPKEEAVSLYPTLLTVDAAASSAAMVDRASTQLGAGSESGTDGGGGGGGAGGGGVDGDERDGMQPARRPAVDPPPESEVGNEIPSVMYF